MNEQELLAVLDMSEDEQVEFFYIKGYRQLVDTFPAGGLRIKFDDNNEIISVKHSQSKLRFDRKALADLAFRFRNEMETGQWPQLAEAYEIVRQHWCKVSWALRKRQGYNKKHISSSFFWLFHSKPIHWIIAALIAKGKKDE